MEGDNKLEPTRRKVLEILGGAALAGAGALVPGTSEAAPKQRGEAAKELENLRQRLAKKFVEGLVARLEKVGSREFSQEEHQEMNTYVNSYLVTFRLTMGLRPGEESPAADTRAFGHAFREAVVQKVPERISKSLFKMLDDKAVTSFHRERGVPNVPRPGWPRRANTEKEA